MEENPLDLEQHEEETLWDVWKRRLMFALLIALCITFAAPTFGSCSTALGSGGTEVLGTYRVGGETVEVTRAQFNSTWSRLGLTLRVVQNRQPDGEEEVWGHILLNAAAEQAGVHVPGAQVDAWLASQPLFQQGGQFDEGAYRAVLSQASDNQLTHRAFSRTLAELLRIQTYLGVYDTAFGLVPSKEAFERWRERNEKLTVSYVVQPFAPIREEVAALEPTEAELTTFSRLPTAAERLRVPPRKTVEAAYFLVRDMTDVQVKEIENVLNDRDLLPKPIVDIGLDEYYGSQDAIFTRENWLRTQRRYHEKALQRHREDLAAWEAQPEETRGAKPEEPPDPALDAVPEDFIERYDKFWRDRVVREVAAREFLRMFAAQAEREGRSFEDLARDYEVIGVNVVRNEEPLPDSEIAEAFPLGLGVDSELAVTVRSALRGPAEGRTFTPEVHLDPVPTTRLGRELDDRGYMALRLAGFEPARVQEVSEAREEIEEMWREHQVQTRAKERLEAIREAVVAEGSDLGTAARDAGLELRTLRRFNRSTPERRPPPLPPGEDEDDARRAVAERLRHRNRILRDYAILQRLEPGSLRDSVLLDDRTAAAYLIRLEDKHLPGPMEVSEPELMAERFALSQQIRQEKGELQSFENLRRRFQLEVREDEPPARDEDEAESEDEAGGDSGS